MSFQQVYERLGKFKSGVSSLTDAVRSGRLRTANRPDANAEMERMTWDNWRVIIDEVAGEWNVSHTSVHRINHEVLQYREESATFVPKQLTTDMKERHENVCEAEGDDFLRRRRVTEVDCWVHYF